MNEAIMMSTVDPTVTIGDHPVPALTTLLHRVCGGDQFKFEEATRLVDLFIMEALSRAASDRVTTDRAARRGRARGRRALRRVTQTVATAKQVLMATGG